MCRICVSLGLVRSIPESRFLVLFLASMFSLNPIFELLLGRGNTKPLSLYDAKENLGGLGLGYPNTPNPTVESKLGVPGHRGKAAK